MDLEKLIPWLWNPYTQTPLVVIGIGYAVRAMPKVRNAYIPALGLTLGTAFFSVVSVLTLPPNHDHPVAWAVSRGGVGFILSAAAWGSHYFLLSYAEDWLGKRFPPLGRWLDKTSDAPETTTKDP